jgi:hypothetical protein
VRRSFSSAAVVLALSAHAHAAELPEHGPLRVLVVSDEVNPNNLDPPELTQPGDISAALSASDSGLNLTEDALEVSSQCVDDALGALSGDTPPDVVVYFAHRSAHGCDNADQQPALTQAFEDHLIAGGGIVVFHHGSYEDAGKEAVLALLGVSASGIFWDTTNGQRVFNVAPDHFVTTNGLDYSQNGTLAGAGDVPSGNFDYFDNVPDERYPNTTLESEADETRTILFASDTGGPRVLSYALERTGWGGRVVFYQPGEYQPHALDDRSGPNFQVLANAIVYSVRQEAGGGDPPGSGGAGSSTGASGSGAESGSNSSGAVGNGAGAEGAAPSSGASSSGASAGTAPSENSSGSSSSDSGGCGCRLNAAAPKLSSSLLALTALAFARRRRRAE